MKLLSRIKGWFLPARVKPRKLTIQDILLNGLLDRNIYPQQVGATYDIRRLLWHITVYYKTFYAYVCLFNIDPLYNHIDYRNTFLDTIANALKRKERRHNYVINLIDRWSKLGHINVR